MAPTNDRAPQDRVRVAKSFSLTFATSLASSAATAVGALVVANRMGARGAGLFALARVVPTVASGLFGLGITVANPYFVGTRRRSLQAIVETNLLFAVLFGSVAFALWLAAEPILAARFFRDVGPVPLLALGAC